MQLISNKNARSFHALVSTFIITFLSFTHIYAQITYTDASGDHQWETAANWDTGVVPMFSDNVTIPSGKTVDITTFTDVNDVDNNGTINGDLTCQGSLINNGILNTGLLLVFGNLENYNFLNADDISCDGDLFNSGELSSSSTLVVGGTSENNGTIETGAHTIFMGNHINNSDLITQELVEFNADLTNNGSITADDFLMVSGNGSNQGIIITYGISTIKNGNFINDGTYTSGAGLSIEDGIYENNTTFINQNGVIEYELIEDDFINNTCALFVQESDQPSTITNYGLVRDLTNNIIESASSSGGIILGAVSVSGTTLTITATGTDMYSIDGGSSFQSSHVFTDISSTADIVLTNATNTCNPPQIMYSATSLISCVGKPEAIATGELNSCDLEFSYDATSSTDNSGASNLMYAWDFGTGAFSFSATGTYSYDDCSVEEVTLIITDPDIDDIFCSKDTLIFQLEYDTEIPQITCPQYTQIFCTESYPIYSDIFSFEQVGGVVTDNCDNLTLELVSSETVAGSCPAYEIILNTYRVTDACGNFSECTQDIGIITDGGPSITFCPEDITLDCGSDTSVEALGTATFDQNGCDFEIVIEDEIPGDPLCQEGYTIMRTFTAIDMCNGNTVCTQEIHVNPPTAPVITSTPPDLTITFGDPLPPIANVSYDNGESGACALSGNVVFNQIVGEPAECGNIYFYHWTEDVCGTILDHMQYITVLPIEEEYLYNCPTDIIQNVVAGELDAVVTYEVSATPYCDNAEATIVQTDGSGLTSGDAFPLGTTIQTYEITSDNEIIVCEFEITVLAGDADLSTSLTFVPGIASGNTLMAFHAKVFEVNDIPSSGQITAVIPKHPSLSITYDDNATQIGSYDVQNSYWTLDNSNPQFHIFQTNESIPAGEFLSFGYLANFNPGSSSGQVSYTLTVLTGSGGETNFLNNIDAEVLIFFTN